MLSHPLPVAITAAVGVYQVQSAGCACESRTLSRRSQIGSYRLSPLSPLSCPLFLYLLLLVCVPLELAVARVEHVLDLCHVQLSTATSFSMLQ